MNIFKCNIKDKMSLEDIYQPISLELSQVDMELKKIIQDAGFNSTQEALGHFLKIPGKRLRPALLLLSYRVLNGNVPVPSDYRLIQLAAAIECVHNASLIHDDIIDGDMMRRGQKTLNNTFGNKIAVLAGDILYSKVFSILSSILPKEFPLIVAGVTEKMCLAEIEQARGDNNTREGYLKIIRDKTALLTSACCRLGAYLAGAKEHEMTSLENYGMNFGMAYQIIDDYADEEPAAIIHISPGEAQKFADDAIRSVMNLQDSLYKESLISLVCYILSFLR